MAKTVFVSGSSRGIGRAVAVELARRGFAVAINGRSESEALSQTLGAIEAAGGQVVAIPGDVTEPANIAKLLDRAEAALGPLSTLVANAGAGPLRRADILDVTPEELMHCLVANTIGPFFLVQEFARRMLMHKKAEGHHFSITIVSSANATAASPNKADYCISKAGTAMIAKLFAQKLSPHGIQVVDVRPGVIETDLSAAVIDEYRRRITDTELALFPRVGQPEDIAKVTGSIAGGDLPYVTGSVIAVDGGLTTERF